ncbi:macrophage mannose receptor 1-like isoform X2 [Apostichopus japonicus]|uniref:macrophage mannose receptor 1-like isoform X2 n=1 Tax=Stichopus japonicus TaxID=307972 RepID=UPI003AB89D24
MAFRYNDRKTRTITIFIELLLVICCLPEIYSADPGCPEGSWSKYAGYCYSTFSVASTWQEGENSCLNNNGHLYWSHSQAEEEFLISTVLTPEQEDEQFWIGLSDKIQEGVFMWSDGSTADYVNFAPADDNANNTCVYLKQNGTTTLWFREDCASNLSYICKVQALDTTTSATTLTTQTQGKVSPPVGSFCPSPWIQVGDSCFEVFGYSEANRKSWVDANQSCKDMDAQLASIHTQAEQSLLVAELLLAGTANVWVGMFSDNGGPFQWEDGSPVDYFKWARDQPDGETQNKSCVELLNNVDEAGRWNDDDCDYLGGYACQKPTDVSYFHTEGPVISICERPNFQPYRESCFYIDPDPVDFNSAVTLCKDLVSNLATVVDGYEEAFLENMIFHKGLDSAWIGLTDAEHNGIYKWVDDWPVWYTNWGHNEPSRGLQEGCVAMMSDGSWNDTVCTETKLPICKFTFDSKPTVPAEVAGYCSSGWSGYGSYCYLPVSGDGEGFTWQEANDQCQILGAELVSIHSKDENEFVELLVETQLTGEDFFWFGLYRNDEDGFSWTDFTPVEYDYWGSREPVSGLEGKDCGLYWSTYGQWSVENCIKTEGYICKTLKIPGTTPGPPTSTDTYTTSPLETSAIISSPSPSQSAQLTSQSTQEQERTTPKLSTPHVSTVSSGPTVTEEQPPVPGKDGLSTGGIIGICFAVLAFLCLVAVLLVFVVRSRNSQKFGDGGMVPSITNAVYAYDSGGDQMRVDDKARII